MRAWIAVLLIIVLAFVTRATAQTTAPATREAVNVPAGFEVVEGDGRRVIVAAEDVGWVPAALETVQPATRPTTMPADVVERLIEQRAWLEGRLARDLLIEDPAVVRAFVDDRLLPRLKAMESAEIPLYYLATTRVRLKELLKSGWADPRFYYNRAADEVMIQPRIELDFDRPLDDLLIPAFYEPDATAEQKQAAVRSAMEQAEGGLAVELSGRAQMRLQMELLQFVEERLMERYEWKGDQVWLRLGLVAVLSAEYAGQITGNPPIRFVAPVVVEPQNVRLRAANIDLLHPTDPTELRREYLRAYMDAMRRKSVAVVWDWLREAKAEDAVPRTLRAVFEQKPGTGEELVRIIREATGVDLGKQLSPG
jgi:hypothetical protein